MQDKSVNCNCLDFDAAFPRQKLSVYSLVRAKGNETLSRLFQVSLMHLF